MISYWKCRNGPDFDNGTPKSFLRWNYWCQQLLFWGDEHCLRGCSAV